MAETFIECKDIDLLAQTPDFMEDAYTHIRNAETNMVTFRDALTNASYQVKNAYYETYNSIYTNIDTERNNLYHLQTNTINIVSAIRAGDQVGAYSIYAEQIATAAAELDNEQNLEDTGAQAAEIQEEENFWNSTWLGKALSWVGDRLEELCATIVGALMTLFEALTNLVEDIVDLVVLLGGAIVSLGASLINFIAGKDVFNVQKIEDWTRSFVAHDFSGSIWESFYEDTGFGQWIKKEDWAQQLGIHDVMVSTAEWIGIAAVGVFTGGAGAAALAAAKGFGSTAERAYAQGASFWGGLGVATVVGVVDGFIGYGIGNAANAYVNLFKAVEPTKLFLKDGSMMLLGPSGKGLGIAGLQVLGKGGTLLLGEASPFLISGAEVLGTVGLGGLMLGLLDPSKGGMISENGAFNVDWNLYKDGDYQGVHDGYHIKGTDSSDPAGGTAREETSEDESTDEETSEETTFDETSEETTDEPTEEQPEPGTTPVTGGGGGGDYTDPEPEAVTPGTDGGGGGSDVQLEPDPVTEPTPEEVPEPTPEEVTEETTEEPTPEEVTEETTEEPTPEEVTEETSEETTEEETIKYPKVTIERTGPESVTIGDPVNENQGSYNGGGGGGGYVNEPSYEDTPISNPVEPTPEITEEPIYNWESATPTVENPDLESVSAEDEVRQVAAREMEVQAVETSGSATLTDVSPIGNMSPAPESTASTYTAPGFDTSMLGMGGVAVTAGGLTTYGITKKSKEEDNSRKHEELDEFSRETEEDKDKFDVI